jgi:hypothetical protein
VYNFQPIELTGDRKRDTTNDQVYEAVAWCDHLRTGDFLLSSIEPTSAAILAFNEEAFDAMTPSFEGEVQLTNFLLELTDLEVLFRLGTQWFRRAAFWRDVLKGSRKLRKLTLKELLSVSSKELANLHLTYAFGVRPFIADVHELYKSLAGYERNISSFLAKRRVPQVRHYQKTVVQDSGQQLGGSTYYTTRTDYTRSSVLNATMKYTYDCPDIKTISDHSKVLRDMLGLRFGLPQLWEAIPFSFVVDWFFRVQDFLDLHFQDPLWDINLTVIDFCVSAKSEIRTHGTIELKGSNCMEDPNIHDVGTFHHMKYVRTRQLPKSGTAFLNPGHFGLNQLALSASLLRSIYH